MERKTVNSVGIGKHVKDRARVADKHAFEGSAAKTRPLQQGGHLQAGNKEGSQRKSTGKNKNR